MDEPKETNAEIYSKLPVGKKLEKFAGLVPIVVSVRDDVEKNRFALTDYKGESRRNEQV